MKRNFLISWTVLIILFSFIVSCKNDNDNGSPPTIHLKTDSGYVHSDTTELIGKIFKVGIVAAKGDANITNFMIKIAGSNTETYLDSGLNSPGFNITKYLVKGVNSQDVWTFIVRDKTGKSASISIKIKADSNSHYGSVLTIPSIIMGAQNDTTTGSFCDIKTASVYNLTQAYASQDSIDFCYYYDFLQGEDNTIASPGANIDASVFTGQYALANWTILNTTRFLATTLTQADFDGVVNDSLLIASFNYPLSKRKAKNLVAGNIYSFETTKSKFGLFRVLSVTGTDAGTVEIMIKIQP